VWGRLLTIRAPGTMGLGINHTKGEKLWPTTTAPVRSRFGSPIGLTGPIVLSATTQPNPSSSSSRRRVGDVPEDMPTLSPAQLAQAAQHHKAMTEAMQAAHARSDATVAPAEARATVFTLCRMSRRFPSG